MAQFDEIKAAARYRSVDTLRDLEEALREDMLPLVASEAIRAIEWIIEQEVDSASAALEAERQRAAEEAADAVEDAIDRLRRVGDRLWRLAE